MDTSDEQVGRLTWYMRRLSSMTPSEMVWRAGRLAAGRIPRGEPSRRPSATLLRPGVDWQMLAERFREGLERPVLLDRARAQNIAARDPQSVSALVAAADRVSAGYVTFFGYPEAHLARPVDWNHDPVRDVAWPQRDSRKIDHRVAVADPKWIWELNRLQHLPWLAEAWLFTGDDGFAAVALDHIETWLNQNPLGTGIAWRGAFEAGVRAISVAVALQGLRDAEALTAERLERIVRMLAGSADLCWRERSRFSSANNHLIGELAGLATVAMLFPELAQSRRWEERALRALDVEASRQILPDGAGAEQAVGYQVFTAELLLVVAALIRARGDTPPPGILAAIDRSAQYLASMVGEIDPDPRYGDDDEGFSLRLGPEPQRTVRDHLGIVAALTGNAEALKTGTMTLTAQWVGALREAPDRSPQAVLASRPASLNAPHGGLVVLRSGNRRLTVDVGPLGYLSIAAHGHADALSMTLSLDGKDVIGDPGAASYYGHPEWRQIHRGTRVHPTVTVDDVDQSVSAGPFLWSQHAAVRVHAVDLRRGVVDAEHDGYQRLPRPVTHRRWVFAPPQVKAPILILDELVGSGEHQMRVSWPLHPSVGLDNAPHGFVLTRDRGAVAQVAIAATTSLTFDTVRGDEGTHFGWWSERLESRLPSWLIGAVADGVVPMIAATVIQPTHNTDLPITGITVSRNKDQITTSWSWDHQRHTAVVDRSRAGVVDFDSFSLS